MKTYWLCTWPGEPGDCGTLHASAESASQHAKRLRREAKAGLARIHARGSSPHYDGGDYLMTDAWAGQQHARVEKVEA